MRTIHQNNTENDETNIIRNQYVLYVLIPVEIIEIYKSKKNLLIFS